MATASAVTDPEPLKCLLCSNVYQVPRSLPCKHTFCEECLGSYIESVGLQISDSEQTFDCPACRYSVTVLDTNPSDIAKEFPLNVLYKSMCRSKYTAQTSCGICLIYKVTTSTNTWCVECGEPLCSDCCEAHKKVRQTMKHQIIDLDNARNKVLAYSRSSEECPKHPGTMLELFCLHHRELCCVLCIPTLHNGCKSIRSLDDIAKRVEKYKEETSFVPEFESMKTEISVIFKQQDLHAGNVDKEYADTLKNVDMLITEAKNKLDQMHDCFQSTLKARRNNRKLALSKVQNETQMLQVNLENCVAIMSAITSQASSRETFVIQEQLKTQLTSHVQEVKTSIRDYRETQLQLEIEDSVSKVVNSISSVGYITEEETQSVPIQNSWTRLEENIDILRQKPEVSLMEDSVSTSDMVGSLVIASPADQMTITTRLVKSVTNETLRQNSGFPGGAYLPDGRLMMADFGNKQIVFYDDNYDMLCKYSSTESINDIAYSDKHRLVFARTGKGIQKYTVSCDALKLISAIPLPLQSITTYLSGIAILADIILLGTDGFVHILELDGTEKKRISRMGECTYVAVCREMGVFCYSDGNGIVCCNADGTETFRYQDEQIDCVRGLSFDKSGNVYVCCAGLPPKVHHISRDGQRRCELVLDQSEIKDPLYVVYDNTKDMLLVTSSFSRLNSNVLFEVFELQ